MKKKSEYDKLVEKYRKEHPGTLRVKAIKLVRVDENGKDIEE
jgi:hypothetical protein